MNPHYHHPPYPDLNSPHSPNSDGGPSNYHGHGGPQGGPPNGHIMNSHHEHMHSHPAFTGGSLSHHGNGPNSMQNYHHHRPHQHLINHSSNNDNVNNTNNSNHSAVYICTICGNVIKDRWVFQVLNRAFHHDCLKCQCCGAYLVEMGQSCFTRDNMMLCKNDYIRLFGNVGSCSGCGQQIPANEMVMRAGVSSAPSPVHPGLHHPVFHLHCFTCSKCGNRLNTGERYYILGNSLYCEMDYNKMLKQPNSMPGQPAGGTTVRKGKVGRPRRSRD